MMSERDALRERLRATTDPTLLRDALESTLTFMDEISTRRVEDPILVAVRTRQLIARRLLGLTDHGVTPPPEVPSD